MIFKRTDFFNRKHFHIFFSCSICSMLRWSGKGSFRRGRGGSSPRAHPPPPQSDPKYLKPSLSGKKLTNKKCFNNIIVYRHTNILFLSKEIVTVGKNVNKLMNKKVFKKIVSSFFRHIDNFFIRFKNIIVFIFRRT